MSDEPIQRTECHRLRKTQAETSKHQEGQVKTSEGKISGQSDLASDGVSPPLVYIPYGQNPLKHWARCSLLKGSFTLENIQIHEHGFTVQCNSLSDGSQPDQFLDIERGNIRGFSSKAARRLRQHLIENWGGEHSHPFAITLTTHEIYTPEQWRSGVKRFREYLARKHPQWAACWRVELQKRKTPHLHCVFYFDADLSAAVVKVMLTQLWLKALREEESSAAWLYAVHVKDLKGASAWVIYCTLHDSKHKKEQLGWIGKQWGVWNRKAWCPRPAVRKSEFTQDQRVVFYRRLRAHSRNRYMTKSGKRAKPLRFVYNKNIAAFAMDSKVTIQLLRGI
uniref:Replication-associated protein ORF2/G2P domain-containing protein n=1 Tax=uncultured prokaryote TaxID=198431 RepID=A0A0H5QPI0_9ZZZZ|nr:hypothetical protein [uncultured prokaryote]